MAFHVVYVAGGELDKVKKVKYVERIHNFAWLTQPYNKMVMMTIPAIEGVYDLDYTTPRVEAELLSLVVTCSGYGENDYYNLWVDTQLWFDTWFPTEVKEGLYIGTSTYVYQLAPETPIKLKFVNISGTQKKVWLGVRLMVDPADYAAEYSSEQLDDSGQQMFNVQLSTNSELNTPIEPTAMLSPNEYNVILDSKDYTQLT